MFNGSNFKIIVFIFALFYSSIARTENIDEAPTKIDEKPSSAGITRDFEGWARNIENKHKEYDATDLVGPVSGKIEHYINNNKDQLDSLNQQAIHNSRQYQKELGEIIGRDVMAYGKKEARKAKEYQISLLMIFISSSMPKHSLEQLAIQARLSGGVLVLRGFIKNSFQESINFIKKLNDNGVAAIIDPLSFRNFSIEHVPAFVVINKDNNCKMGRCDQTPLHDKISGNISLNYALEQIANYGEYGNEEAAVFLSNLQQGMQ